MSGRLRYGRRISWSIPERLGLYYGSPFTVPSICPARPSLALAEVTLPLRSCRGSYFYHYAPLFLHTNTHTLTLLILCALLDQLLTYKAKKGVKYAIFPLWNPHKVVCTRKSYFVFHITIFHQFSSLYTVCVLTKLDATSFNQQIIPSAKWLFDMTMTPL